MPERPRLTPSSRSGPTRSPSRRAPALLLGALVATAAAGQTIPPGRWIGGSLDRRAAGVHHLVSSRGVVTLRSSADGDPQTWEGLIQASHAVSGAGVAYSVQVRLAGSQSAQTIYALPIEHLPAIAARCRAPRPLGGAIDRNRRNAAEDLDAMAFYRCALRRCFSRSRRCVGPAAEATSCLAGRCRGALLACLHDTLGCRIGPSR